MEGPDAPLRDQLGELRGRQGAAAELAVGDEPGHGLLALGHRLLGEVAPVVDEHRGAVGREHLGDEHLGQRALVEALLHALRHLAGRLVDAAHERLGRELAALHLAQAVLPLAGQLGVREQQQGIGVEEALQLEGLGGGDELLALALDVGLAQQALDGGGARGRRAQAALLHGLGQRLVVDQLAGVLHGAEQRGLVVAGGRLGGVLADVHRVDLGLGGGAVGRAGGGQVGAALLVAVLLGVGLLAPDGAPAGDDQDLAGGAEGVRADLRRAHGLLELGHGEEHRDEAADDEVVDARLDVAQALGDRPRRHDGEVVADLGVVEDALAGAVDPALGQRLLGEAPGGVAGAERGQDLLGRGDVVLGQVARVGAGVGEGLVPLVEGLGGAERRLGREAEAPVGLALQGREVEEAGGALLLGLALVGDDARADAPGGLGHGAGLGLVVEALGLLALLDPGHLGGAAVAAGGEAEVGLDAPEHLRDEVADLMLAADDEHERRRLHAADGVDALLGDAAAAEHLRGAAGEVEADHPVGLRAADGRRAQARLLGRFQQVVERLPDRRRGHARQPQALLRQAGAGQGADHVEDELALAAGVAGVDHERDVVPLQLLLQQVEALRRAALLADAEDALVQRAEEVVRQDGQRGEGPALPVLVQLVGLAQLDQVADRRGDHPAVVLVHLALLGHLEDLGQVVGHRGLLGDDEGLARAGGGGGGGFLGGGFLAHACESTTVSSDGHLPCSARASSSAARRVAMEASVSSPMLDTRKVLPFSLP